MTSRNGPATNYHEKKMGSFVVDKTSLLSTILLTKNVTIIITFENLIAIANNFSRLSEFSDYSKLDYILNLFGLAFATRLNIHSAETAVRYSATIAG